MKFQFCIYNWDDAKLRSLRSAQPSKSTAGGWRVSVCTAEICFGTDLDTAG